MAAFAAVPLDATDRWSKEEARAVRKQGLCPLKVTMVSARGLRQADWGILGFGNPNPFCKCEIQGKPQAKIKTSVEKKTMEPSWGHESDFPDYVHGDVLMFTVWDKDRLKSDDLLGKAYLACGQFIEAGFDGELRLAEAGKDIQAFVRVKVQTLQHAMEGRMPAKVAPVEPPVPRCTEKGVEKQMRVSDLRFTMQTIRSELRDGRPLYDLVNDLMERRLDPSADMEPLRVIEHEGRCSCLSNRRLWALKAFTGFTSELLFVRVEVFSLEQAAAEFKFKNSTTNGGLFAHVG